MMLMPHAVPNEKKAKKVNQSIIFHKLLAIPYELGIEEYANEFKSKCLFLSCPESRLALLGHIKSIMACKGLFNLAK